MNKLLLLSLTLSILTACSQKTDPIADIFLDYQGENPGAAVAIIQNMEKTYFLAGEQFRYSNTAYALLALMVEKYSGQDFPGFLEENIFSPLGMNATIAHIKNQNTVFERAYGYTKENGQWIRKDQSSTSAVLGDG